MKVEFYFIEELSTDRVAFYTVLLGDNDQKPTEYEEFVKRMNIKAANKFDLAEMQKFMRTRIGATGLFDEYFKNEKNAERIKQRTPDEYDPDLPDPKDYGLRLYCLRLSDKIVVLFNGDRKTTINPKDCPNCEPYFTMANCISVAIKKAIDNGDIYFENFDIVYKDQDDNEEPFYVTI